MYRVVTEVSGSGSLSSAVSEVKTKPGTTATRTLPEAEAEPYRGQFRDPFAHALGAQRPKAGRSVPGEDTSANVKSPSPSPLQLRLIGIIGKTALLRGQGTTRLVSEGDSMSAAGESVLIRAVSEQAVVAVRERRVDTLKLPPPKWRGQLLPKNER